MPKLLIEFYIDINKKVFRKHLVIMVAIHVGGQIELIHISVELLRAMGHVARFAKYLQNDSITSC